MRVDRNQTIAGQPAVDMRDFFRKIRYSHITVASPRDYFKINKKGAQKIITQLVSDCYLEVSEIENDLVWYKTTSKGLALSQASAARPLLRASAESKLKKFLDRVLVINVDDYYLYFVKRVVLFGSYLSDRERINDIDLAIELSPKHEESIQHSMNEERIRQASQLGRTFRSDVDEILYPRTEICKYLKSRSWAISLHEIDGIPEGSKQHLLFENGKIELPIRATAKNNI